MMENSTVPVDLAERRALRRASMPDALTAEQLRKSAVGRMRWTITQIIEDNAGRVQEWIDMIALVDGPKEALDMYIKMLEYAVPKLSRAVVSVEDGGKTQKAELTMAELQQIIREAPRAPIDGECTRVPDPVDDSS